MDKNLVLAVVLSMLVYLGWFGFVEKRFAPPSTRTAASPAVTPSIPGRSAEPGLPGAAVPPPSSTGGGSAGPAAVPAPASSTPAQPAQAPAPSPSIDRARLERDSDRVSLDGNDLLIHPRGAGIVSFRFQGPLGPVELIDNPAPGFLSIGPEMAFRKEPPLGPGAAYSARRPDGLRILKEFLPGTPSVLPRLRLTLSNESRSLLETGPWTLHLGPGLGTVASEKKENAEVWRTIGFTAPDASSRGRVEKLSPGEHPASRRWFAVDNRYFLAAAVLPAADFEKVQAASPPFLAFVARSASLAPGASKSVEIPFFLGPKAQGRLAAYGLGFERAIDLGFFAQLGRFTLRVLVLIHDRLGNWGWSIIILTLAIQTVMFPLTYKSLKAAAAMKRLGPEMARLQQQFSKDPARLNSEMMELYKRSGANPLGGCLPMLLQMPVFIALFNTLRNSWELHGATWIFWIKDLSSKDPYYVLPLVMGGLMFYQNKLNPAPADPAQAKMMLWMPVIFTFMFLNFPSGLVLYWMTNSVVSTVQQLALRDHFDRLGTR